MARTVESRQRLYAFTSAHTTAESPVAGIGVIIKAVRRHTLRKLSRTAHTTDPVVAAYEAIALALREAHAMGARAIVVYTDCQGVIRQLAKVARVDDGQLARHLEARSLLNQFHRAEVRLATPEQSQTARRLAAEAWEEARGMVGGAASQLPLPLAETGTG